MKLKNCNALSQFPSRVHIISHTEVCAYAAGNGSWACKKKIYNNIVASTGASTATISRVNRTLNSKYSGAGYRIVFDRLGSGSVTEVNTGAENGKAD